MKHPMIMSHRKSKWASAPVLVVAISSPDPTIDPAKMSLVPSFSVYQGVWGGFLTFEFVGLIGQGILLVKFSFRKSNSWGDEAGSQLAN